MNNVEDGFYWYKGSSSLDEPADFTPGKWQVIEVVDGIVYATGSEITHHIYRLHGELLTPHIPKPTY